MIPMPEVGANWLYPRTPNIFPSSRESRLIIDTIGLRTRRLTGNQSSMHTSRPGWLILITGKVKLLRIGHQITENEKELWYRVYHFVRNY